MPRFDPARAAAGRRHRRVVGHRRGHGADAGRGRLPGRARRPAGRQVRGDRRPRSAPTAARPSALPLDVTDADSVDAFVAAPTDALGADRGGRRRTPATSAARLHEIDPDDFAPGAGQPARRPAAGHRGAAGDGRAPARRHRVRHLRRRACAAPAHGRLRRGEGGPRGLARAMQMELEGTGVRVSHRAARPDHDRRWAGTCAPNDRARARASGRSGAGPARRLPAPAATWRGPSRSSPTPRGGTIALVGGSARGAGGAPSPERQQPN